MLCKAATEVGTLLLDLYEAAGLHPVKGKRLVSDLEARGFVRQHRLPRRGRGGQPTVLEVLEPGLVELRKRDIEPAGKLIGRGGFKHDLYGRWIASWGKAQGMTAFFDKLVGKKAFDVTLRTREGGLIGVEICLSGSLKYNLEQLEKAASVRGVLELVVVSDDRSWLDRMRKRVLEEGLFAAYAGTISYRHVTEFAPVSGRFRCEADGVGGES